MRENLMANRMRYLQTILRKIRAEVSTTELISNPKVLEMIRALEIQLYEMEIAYVGKPDSRNAV